MGLPIAIYIDSTYTTTLRVIRRLGEGVKRRDSKRFLRASKMFLRASLAVWFVIAAGVRPDQNSSVPLKLRDCSNRTQAVL